MISKYGYYKVATGNFIVKVGNVENNKNEIINLINEANKERINVLVFPEMSLVGYTIQDLVFHKELFNEELNSLKDILKVISKGMIVFVGGYYHYLNKLYNVTFVLNHNGLRGIVPKSYLPNNNEFYEKRWFSSGKDIKNTDVIIDNKKVPFGSDLIFDCGELKVGAEICEDLWVVNPPSNDLCLAGANVIVNLSASNEVIAKKDYRRNLVSFQSGKNYCGYVYSSCGFGESSQDLVFSGHQIIASSGNIVKESYDQLGLTVGIVDIDKSSKERIRKISSFEATPSKEFRYINVEDDLVFETLPSKINSYPFVLKDLQKRRERSKEIIALQAKGLATKLYNTNFKDVVIGVSGGLDSTLALIVCCKGFEYLKLDKKGIHILTLPGFGTTKHTKNNAIHLIEKLGLEYKTIDIKKLSKQHLLDLEHPLDEYDVVYENTQARIRTLYLMNYANAVNGLVIGTGDLSEIALGFATYNGDHMSMYGVNSSIPKTLIKALLIDYACDHPEVKDVIKKIIDTPISPELIPGSKGKIVQETENILGKYDLHDFFLYHFIRNCFTKEKILELAKIAFNKADEEYIKKTLDLFIKRFFSQQFKRSCMPDGVKVGTVSLSPRGDFRMASDLDPKNTINK